VNKMSDSVMLTGKQIPIARLMALLKGMGLEEKGLKVGRGRSCMAIVKSEFGWKGNRRKIMTLLADHIQYLLNQQHKVTQLNQAVNQAYGFWTETTPVQEDAWYGIDGVNQDLFPETEQGHIDINVWLDPCDTTKVRFTIYPVQWQDGLLAESPVLHTDTENPIEFDEAEFWKWRIDEYLNRKYVASYLFPDDADDEYKEAGEIIEWTYPASNEWTDDQVFEEFCKVVDRGDRIKREHFIARDIDAEKQLQ